MQKNQGTKGAAPAPILFPGDEPFWEAAKNGQMLAKRCTACGELHYYPRVHCPLCGSGHTEWEALCGRGVVYSYSIVARSPRPTAPVIIETEEGLRIHSVIVDADVHALRIGHCVSLRFIPGGEGYELPVFTTPSADLARTYSKEALRRLGAPAPDGARHFAKASVIGAGNMGIGIALTLLAGGMAVYLMDTSTEQVESGAQRLRESLAQDLTRGRLSEAERDRRLGRLTTGTNMALISDSDLVIEAVWEDLAVKQQIFASMDAHAHPDAILATNTSTLDVGQIAAATGRPGSVVGMHFFNPAQVMRLLEVVRSPATSAATIAATKAVARQIGKVPVVVGICDGFVGNRLMITRERQAAKLLLDGALPEQIDRVLREFGLPMGTFELQDMAGGIALTYRARQRAGQKDWLIEQLHERGRLGLRAGRGYYKYEPGKRRPIPDPEVIALIEEASRLEGITRRDMSAQEIQDRLILPMINEGAKLVTEGVVERASDIDLVWQFGYGWPDWKGGPMYYADEMGIATVVSRLRALHAQHGEVFKPADLLVRLAESGGRLSDQTN
jgi:3-hydroxyacyl-CoA dehydrogenase